jgi:hypothetical protein
MNTYQGIMREHHASDESQTTKPTPNKFRVGTALNGLEDKIPCNINDIRLLKYAYILLVNTR